MAVTVDTVRVELEAKVKGYLRDVEAAETRFIGAMQTMERSNDRMGNNFAKNANNISSAARGIGAAIGAVSALALARGLLNIADEAKNLDAQLRLATSQTGSFGVATEDVRRIAEATRSGLTETATLYGNFQRNAQDLGITQLQAARATETFAKTLSISGSGASESAASIRQFSQALASGTLRGDEFNSIMENAPRLARLLATSLGVPVGALRAMAEEGQLTADKLTAALTDKRYTDGIDAEFKELPVTFEQAMVQVQNAAVITFGAFDRGGEFSTALANFITDGTGGFAELEKGAEQFGIDVRATLAGLSDAFAPIIGAGLDAFQQLTGASSQFGINIRRDIQTSLDDIDKLTGFLSKRYNNSALTAIPKFFTGESSGSDLGGRNRRGVQQTSLDGLARRLTSRDALERSLREFQPPETAGPARVIPAKLKPTRKPRGPSADTIARREEAAADREERRQQAHADELARIDQDIADARRALETSATIIVEIERQKIRDAQKNYEAGLASDVKTGKLKAEEAEERRKASGLRAQAETDVVDFRERERLADEQLRIAQNELRDAMDIEQLSGQLATTREDRKASELRLLDLQYQEEKQALQRIRDNDRLDQRVRGDAARALGDLDTKRDLQQRDIDRQNMSPLDRYRDEIGGSLESMNDQLENVEVQGLRALSDELTNAAKKALGLSGALGDVVGQLIQVGIQRAIIGPIADSLFGKDGGGGGLIGGFLSNLIGGASRKATGGPTVGLTKVGENGEEWVNFGGRPAWVTAEQNIPRVMAGGRTQGVNGTIRLELSGDLDARIVSVSGPVAIEVQRVTRRGMVEEAVNETSRRLGRPRL